MSDKHKQKDKDKDKKRKDGKDHDKEAKRARQEAERRQREAAEDSDSSDGGKHKKKKAKEKDGKEHKHKVKEKEKDKENDKEKKHKEKEKHKDREKEKSKAAEKEPAAAKPADTSAAAPAAKKAEAEAAKKPEKKLKAWQDDELEIESDDEAKEADTRLQALSGVASRSLGQPASAASSSTAPAAAPAAAAAAAEASSGTTPGTASVNGTAVAGAASGEAAPEAAAADEPDPLDAFMEDLARAKLDKKPPASEEGAADGAAAEGSKTSETPTPVAQQGMGVMDSSRVKSITLEEIEALMGVRREGREAGGAAAAASPDGGASPPADGAATAGAPAAPSQEAAGAAAASAQRSPPPAEEEDDEEDDRFHAAFLAEMKRLREGGAAAPEPVPEEGAGPNFQPSKSFKGARPGFVFKKGSLGLGYYRDVAAKPVSSSAAPPAAKPTGGYAAVVSSKPNDSAKADGEASDSSSDDSSDSDEDEKEEEEQGAADAEGKKPPEADQEAAASTAAETAAAAGSPAAGSPSAPAAAEGAGGEGADAAAAASPAAASSPVAAADEGGGEQPAKVVETKKEKRRKRREAKQAEQRKQEVEKKRKAKDGFGGEGEQLMENDAERSEESEEEVQESYFDLVKRFTTKKSLPAVDHSTIEYLPFRKNLYVQVKEITNMRDHEVEDLRRTMGDIRVRGKHCPHPIKTFLQCGLPEKIIKILERRDYEKPFPIQMQAIPALMCGRDMIGVAQTGSGKTLAYLLPAIRHVMDQPKLKDGDGPIAFVIAPTRELALQIQREANTLGKAVGLTSVCAYGGGPMGEQLSALKKGAEILVGTPGRLIDVLTTSGGKITNLRRVTFLVLDEADRMFDMGFEPQIGMFLQTTRPDKQVAMFSATLPTHVEALARTVLKRPLEITVGERNTAATNVTQFVEVLEETQKFYRLLQLLGEWHEHGSIMIFVHQQKDVDEMFTELLKFGYPSLALHGGQDQHDRDFTLQDFKDGVASILIATSVAARGIDVKSVVLVVNFKVPDHLEDYIHRIGRTGRAGKQGFAYTFVQPDEAEHAQDMVDALRQCSQEVPLKLKQLAEEHQSQVNVGQAKKKRRWGGFGGKGFKYDNSEKSQQQKDRQKAKQDMLIGTAEERMEEEQAFKDPWDEDKPMKGKGKGKGNDKEEQAQPKAGAPAASSSSSAPMSSTVAAAAEVARKMQAEAAAKAPAAAPTPGVGSTPADFIPAVAFQGSRPGMSFKMGPKGLGYYLDSGGLSAGAASAPAPGGSAPAAATAPPPPPPPAPISIKGGKKKSDQELEEQAQQMAEATLRTLLEGEKGDEVREKQLPALKAKLKEKLRKAQEEQAATPKEMAPPPPPKAVPKAEPDGPLMMALPLVPGVLGTGVPEPSMVLRSMEQLQGTASKAVAATAQEAQEVAQALQGGNPLVPAGMHMDEFEINDYPQVARQRISHRDPLLAIEEISGAKCWIKGQYFADERKIPEGGKKLYVEIIGPTLVSVQKAKQEVRKMMEALAIRTLNIPGVSRAVMGTPGRYDPATGK